MYFFVLFCFFFCFLFWLAVDRCIVVPLCWVYGCVSIGFVKYELNCEWNNGCRYDHHHQKYPKNTHIHAKMHTWLLSCQPSRALDHSSLSRSLWSLITLSPTLWWHFGTKMLKTKQKKAFEKSICVLLCTDTLQHSQLGRFGVSDCECNCCSLLNSWPILLLIALMWISFTKLCCTHFRKRWERAVSEISFFFWTDRWRIFWPLRWCWICGKPLFVVFITALNIVSAVLRESHPSIVRWG